MGCSNEETDKAKTKDGSREVHLDSVKSVSTGTYRPDSLCGDIEEYDDGAGVYVIEDIVHYPQAAPGKTFLKARRKSDWTPNAPQNVKITMFHGPTPGGGYRGGGTYPAFSKGEIVGMMFKKRALNGKEHYLIHKSSVFKKKGSGYTNGHLFVRQKLALKQIGKKVNDLYRGLKSGRGCPYDVQPVRKRGRHPELDAGSVEKVDLAEADGS